MQKTVNLMRGFARVSVECAFPERFINLCAYNNIAFWGVERVNEVRIEATITAGSLEQTERLVERLGGKITLLGKRGALFFLERFKSRYVLIAGLFICMAALFMSNRYIWEFTVEGNETVSSEEILQALRDIGVTLGSPSSDIDIVSIRNQMLLKMKNLSWISVNVSGSRASVVVRERVEKPDIFLRSMPVNVLAEKAGLITRIDTLSGSAQVFPGDMVQQGQLLVSGLVDSAQVGVRLVNARADVTARTWSELTAVAPTGALGKKYTGRSKTRYALVFGGRRVNLYLNTSQPYAMCDKMSETSVLRIGRGTFPFSLVKETYTEYEPVSYQMDEEVAQSILRQSLEQSLRASILRGDIVSEEVTFSVQPGIVFANLTAESLERIDVSKKVDLGEVLGLP